MTTENILSDYNRQIVDSEICFKNNRDQQHDWESVSRENITNEIIEILCFCCNCGAEKYIYDYYLEHELT